MNSFKICLVGESASGKSSILSILKNKPFNQNISQTIGCDYWRYTQENKSFEIYDTSGLDKFKQTTINSMKGSNLIIICFDFSSNKVDQHVEKWLNIVRTYKSVTPIIFIGNKIDKPIKQESKYINRLKQNYPFYFTSSTDSQKVKGVFNEIVNHISQSNLIVERVQIRPRQDLQIKSSWCCFC
ncbi:unnamed protein product [Paramecium primaurelia]|uniref:Small GTP-binding protein n=1 Tax=Paramecium primaurelia TaxID=5886 RepID=A0A8S1JUV9_PARPR|nr:unnamed protein product [Paramecium primaurelia]